MNGILLDLGELFRGIILAEFLLLPAVLCAIFPPFVTNGNLVKEIRLLFFVERHIVKIDFLG